MFIEFYETQNLFFSFQPARYFIFPLLKEVVTKKNFPQRSWVFIFPMESLHDIIQYILYNLLYDIDFTIISWAQQGFQQCRQKFCNFATLLWKFPNFTSQLFLLKATSQIVNCEELVQLCYASWNVNPLSANSTKWLNTLTLTLRMVRWLAIMI